MRPLGPVIHQTAALLQDGPGPYRPRPSTGLESCRRKLWYQAVGVEPKPRPGRSILTMGEGDHSEARNLALLDRSLELMGEAGVKVLQRQTPVRVPGHWFAEEWRCGQCSVDGLDDVFHIGYAGHIDALLDIDGKTVLFENKSISAIGFDNYENQREYPADYCNQIAQYAIGLTAMGIALDGAILLLERRDSQAIMEYHFGFSHGAMNLMGVYSTRKPGENLFEPGKGNHPPSIIMTQVVAEYAARDAMVRDMAKAPPQLPDRDYPMEHWRCGYCEFGSTCWAGYEEETGIGEPQPPGPEPSWLHNQIEKVRRARNTRLAAGKEEEMATAELIRLAGKHKMGEGRWGDYEFKRAVKRIKNTHGEEVQEEVLNLKWKRGRE